MNRFWGWAAVALLLLVLSGCLYMGSLMGLAVSACSANSEIPASERDAIAEQARGFVQLVRDGETEAMLQAMSENGRAQTQRISAINLTEMSLRHPPGRLQTGDVFKVITIGSERGVTPCSGREGIAFVSRGSFRSMFVEIEETLSGGARAWTFWFERERGAWRVRGVHLGYTILAERTGAQMWALAVEQRRKGNVFNSTALYDLANLLLDRGSFYRPADANGFAAERRMYRRHQDILRANFQLGAAAFPIASMNAVATDDGHFIFVLEQSADLPVTETEADVRNRALIDGLNAHRPEWREVFDGVSAAYPIGPHRAWRTLYLRDSGYSTPPQN